MLATLVALKLWARVSKQKSFSTVWIRGRTDNQSNTAALKKWMSTKFPLTLIIMELSETLRSCGRFLDLAWLPREQNQLADDLTNENFRCFPDHLRKRWNAAGEKWMVLSYFAEKSHEFYNEIAKRKIERPPQERKSKKRKKLERWWLLVLRNGDSCGSDSPWGVKSWPEGEEEHQPTTLPMSYKEKDAASPTAFLMCQFHSCFLCAR